MKQFSLVKRCFHKRLPVSPSHQMDRSTPEWQELHSILTRSGFIDAFRRSSPRKDTAWNENFHSVLLTYCPKRLKM